jgi:hypothetical protein
VHQTMDGAWSVRDATIYKSIDPCDCGWVGGMKKAKNPIEIGLMCWNAPFTLHQSIIRIDEFVCDFIKNVGNSIVV